MWLTEFHSVLSRATSRLPRHGLVPPAVAGRAALDDIPESLDREVRRSPGDVHS